jgi:hypothetical protein
VKKLLFLLVLGAGAAVIVPWPEIQRYMKIKNM